MGMAFATAAAADPITIVGGSLVIGGGLGRRFPETSISFSLTGDEGFSASGSAGEDSINNSGALCALFVPGAAGTTLNVGGGFLIGDGIGSATVGGTTYGTAFFSGAGAFAAGSAMIPVDGGDQLVLQSPFTFAGQLGIGAFDGVIGRRFEVGTVALNGTGMASVFLTRIGDRYGITQRRLDFAGAAASPTPEPGSLLLFGMGAVMLIRRRASAHLGIVD